MNRTRFAALLALLHLYIGARLLPPLPLPVAAAGAVVLLALYALLIATAASMLRGHPERPWRTWAGLIAVGFFSSLLVFTVLREPLLLAAAAAGVLRTRIGGVPVLQASAWAVPAGALLATLWGLANARRRPPVREVDVPLPDLPDALLGLTIVQISDLHVGPTIRRPFVQSVVDAANALQPDLIAVTGDSVDGSVEALRDQIAPFAELKARLGVFAVTGNHEYYSGAAHWVAELRRLGLQVLMNQHVVLRHREAALVLAGVTDFSAGHFDPSQASDPAGALRGAPQGTPRVLLAHQPRSADAAAAAGFDLQLSGHTHGGQFFPWRWFVPLQQPYTAGLHRHGRMWIYTSRGTGYWGPPKRLGAPSEITRLRLVRPPA